MTDNVRRLCEGGAFTTARQRYKMYANTPQFAIHTAPLSQNRLLYCSHILFVSPVPAPPLLRLIGRFWEDFAYPCNFRFWSCVSKLSNTNRQWCVPWFAFSYQQRYRFFLFETLFNLLTYDCPFLKSYRNCFLPTEIPISVTSRLRLLREDFACTWNFRFRSHVSKLSNTNRQWCVPWFTVA